MSLVTGRVLLADSIVYCAWEIELIATLSLKCPEAALSGRIPVTPVGAEQAALPLLGSGEGKIYM